MPKYVKKDPAIVSAARAKAGAKGGRKRARVLTKSARSAVAKKGAAARWKKP